MPGMATREEIAKLKAAKGTDVDILFLQYMLRHHLGGIHMVDGVLAENPTREVKDLAETMKNEPERRSHGDAEHARQTRRETDLVLTADAGRPRRGRWRPRGWRRTTSSSTPASTRVLPRIDRRPDVGARGQRAR